MIPLLALATSLGGVQLSIPRIELLPDRPTPYAFRNWTATAHEFGRVVFDENAQGPYLPLVWPVPNVPNLDGPGFGLPSYVGKEETRGKTGEGIASFGSLLGPTMVGVDMRRWVERTPQFLNAKQGRILNDVGSKGGGSFWYDLFAAVSFVNLASKYPEWERGQTITRQIAAFWRTATVRLNGDFDHTSYDPDTGKPIDNGQWKEPEAAAGAAYLQLFEALRSSDPSYLKSARQALQSLQRREDNPTYEILLPFGAVSAAYLNANYGERWDTPRFLSWCFDPTSSYRVGWGMIAGRWNGYDVGGLIGSTNDAGGYAFAMNTFVTMAALAPVARYDDRYSASLAKWILNTANASRLFYRDTLDAKHQSSFDWPGDPKNSIAYEGLRKAWDGQSPFATGDAKRSGWAKEDFGVYGAGYVGLLAALAHPTNVPEILRIDLRATDFLPTKGYPTDLYWNPYAVAKTVKVELGRAPVRLYDAVGNRFLSEKPIGGTYALRLGAKQSVQLVRVPAQGKPTFAANRTLVNGLPIDFNNGRKPLPEPVKRPRTDQSVSVGVPRAIGGTVNWAKADTIKLAGGAGGTMRADLRFGWDADFIYFRLDQRAAATETLEAPNRGELRKHRWDFEHVELAFDPSRETFPVTRIPEFSVGWSSTGRTDLVYSDDLPDRAFQVKTLGEASNANRVIEGKVAWRELYRVLGTPRALADIARTGSKIGCQPLLTDGTFRRQAYLNGKPYTRPTGFDRESRTLVLK